MLSERLQLDEDLLQERKLSVTDALTGVYNRSYFDEVIPRELKRATRQKHGLSLLLLDVDNFRRLNDEKGRGVGDYALRELVGVLKQSLRATDYMFRFGGDEFLVALIEIKAGASEIVRHPHSSTPGRSDRVAARVGRGADPNHRRSHFPSGPDARRSFETSLSQPDIGEGKEDAPQGGGRRHLGSFGFVTTCALPWSDLTDFLYQFQ